MQEAFEQFLSERFPLEAKRGMSGVIRAAFGQSIIHALKDPAAVDKNLRFYVKKTQFRVLDIPSLGIQNVPVVPRKDMEVSVITSFRMP